MKRIAFPLAACLLIVPLLFTNPYPDLLAQSEGGVAVLTGNVVITNPAVIEHLSVERSVSLFDMVAFVKRDDDLHPPYLAQPITALEGDLAQGAEYTLPLPIVPRAALNRFGNGQGAGVQIYSVIFDTNFFGDAFNGPFESGGWPAANSSLSFDPGNREVRGGRLLIWSPDADQMFPSDFGADAKLFTADDPLEPVPSGWTVIDLDERPFAQIRDESVDMPIIEGDTGSVDLSNLSYTEAFDALIRDLRLRYAMSEFKQIDYDALIAEFRPTMEQAERTSNTNLYKLALFRLAERFHDGHVSATLPPGYLGQFVGGIGLSLAETDDGTVIVRTVAARLPADRAGIKPGAQIIEWGGKPVSEAISEAEQPMTHSSAHTRRLSQVAFLSRMVEGARVRFTYQNPGATQPKEANLRAVQDIDGLIAAFPFGQQDFSMPITVKVLPSGLGYIKITTFLENPQLLVQTWEWAIRQLNAEEVPGLIIDLRENGGGFSVFPSYFAGSFFDKEFILYTSYRADTTGTFIRQGDAKVKPTPFQWTKPFAVLVGSNCASACELFAAALQRSEKAIIVGSYATYGIAGGLYGPWLMPEKVEFNAPVVQPRTPDGSIFLEDVGVQPTVKVPVTVESLLSTEDNELPIAEKALLEIVGD